MYRAVIILSAYGDCPYLAEQVASITGQMGIHDLLIIVDDGSRAVRWADISTLLPNKYRLWTRLHGLGSSLSFIDLLIGELSEESAQYYFFADQDDIWLPGKLDGQLKATPSSGMSVHAWQVFRHTADSAAKKYMLAFPVSMLSRLHYYFETPAPGMTMCIGAQARCLLKNQRDKIIDAAIVVPHDRVLAALVAMQGLVICLPSVWVRYRQHSNNLIGAPYNGWLRRAAARWSRWQLTRNQIASLLVLIEKTNKNIKNRAPKNTAYSNRPIWEFLHLRQKIWESLFLTLLIIFLFKSDLITAKKSIKKQR